MAETQLQATPVARACPTTSAYGALAHGRRPGAGPLGEVLAAWQGLGYPRRARNLHAAAGSSPSGWPERLTDLPGVGPYTEAAIRCFADGEDVLPVDTNAARVLARRSPRLAGRAGPGGPSARP